MAGRVWRDVGDRRNDIAYPNSELPSPSGFCFFLTFLLAEGSQTRVSTATRSTPAIPGTRGMLENFTAIQTKAATSARITAALIIELLVVIELDVSLIGVMRPNS